MLFFSTSICGESLFIPWERMPFRHLSANRGWELIRDKGQLTYEESVHIAECEACNGWMIRFVAMAKKAGFEIKLWIPPLDSRTTNPPDSESTD